MIVDTHVHVWEIDPPKYPVGPTAPTWNSYPDEPGTTDELLAEMNAHGIDWAVLVQTSWSTWDNGYIADSAARFPIGSSATASSTRRIPPTPSRSTTGSTTAASRDSASIPCTIPKRRSC